jgi:hypothetical protein
MFWAATLTTGTATFGGTSRSSTRISCLFKEHVSNSGYHSGSCTIFQYHVGKSPASPVCARRIFTSKFWYFSPIALLVTRSKHPAPAADLRASSNGAASLLNIFAVKSIISRPCWLLLSKTDPNKSRCALAATVHAGRSSMSLR